MKEIDKTILNHLMKDATITNGELAELIGLSPSATLERVKKLEQEGIIEGKTLLIQPKNTERALEFFMTFSLKNQGPQDIKKFEKAILKADEVISCAQLLGRFDFIAHVAVKDMDEMRAFIEGKLIALGLIGQMESLTVLNMVKRHHPPYFLKNAQNEKGHDHEK
jgi:Lrp/AsnC family leucine-responsive transcriptional regulator